MRVGWVIAGLALVGCASDPDGDGLTNAEERELGTLSTVADTDGDGLDDGEEVLEHGTDPTVRDTDQDGFEDGEEVAAGTDGADPLDYPASRWPDGSERVPDDARAWTVGSHVPDFGGTDQRGDTLSLDRLYGHVVVVQLVAGTFCSDCAQDAAQAQGLQGERGSEGLWVVHVLVDDDSRDGAVEADFAATWADRHGLSFPALVDGGQQAASGLFEGGLYDGTVPLTVLLDRRHHLAEVYAGRGGLAQAIDDLDPLLDQPAP